MSKEKQLTCTLRNHQLTNINIWTHDSQWIVFDVRPNDNEFSGLTIERVNVETGRIEVIYQAKNGAHVGVVTVSPTKPIRYAFIHGPEYPDATWHYDVHHRHGVIVTESCLTNAVTLDAMDITPPFTAGALRGGSHVHVFSPDSSRLSFTYNDHVLHEDNPVSDLRNIGIAVPLKEVIITADHPREHSGSHFCVLISETISSPELGSDQISRAYEEGWVGLEGYMKTDGSKQRWALAFIGDTTDRDGAIIPEVFVIDLPDLLSDYAKQGASPLSGTSTRLPAPPANVKQRRITRTQNQRYPGVVRFPRHWLRSSPNGQYIAFLMKDNGGITQLWLVSPNGGQLRQLTNGRFGINSAFSWSPNGHQIAFVMDNSIVVFDFDSRMVKRVTKRSTIAPLPNAVVFSPDGQKIAFLRNINGFSQIFYVEYKLYSTRGNL